MARMLSRHHLRFVVLLILFCGATALKGGSLSSKHALLQEHSQVSSSNRTVNNSQLQTWWHATGEINHQTGVENGNVRQSHLYSIQVSSSVDAGNTYYDSFVYESIPRNGNGNILVPGDPSSLSNQNDGVSIEADVGLTMAWTQFLYWSEVTVKIHRLDGYYATAENIAVRPSGLDYSVTDWLGDIYITIPHSDQGVRFSVEFEDNLYAFHDACNTSACGYTQDQDPKNPAYVNNYTSGNPIMGIEPHDALLIFASTFPPPNLVPNTTSPSSLVVPPGLVTGLDQTEESTVIFNPGVYWLTGTSHANLSSNVNWVHIAPGAYVKGAIQFTSSSPTLTVTGAGVLSGEQYVYQANPAANYTNDPSNTNSLRLWTAHSCFTHTQTFILNGVTVASPPFNSMDFTGDLSSVAVNAWDYKQVGAYFAQTDGLELYPGSVVKDVFYHSNDDTIKTYYSNVSVARIIVWKAHTAPVIQFGWASRNITNVTVSDVDIIHMRWDSNGSHAALIGANQVYGIDEEDSTSAETSNVISDISYTNIRAEGICGALLRICPLANIRNFTISNVSIEGFTIASSGIPESQFPSFSDSETGKAVSVEGFVVEDFYVGGTKVSFDQNNWDSGELGAMNVDPTFIASGGVLVL